MQNLKLFITGHKGFETALFHELRAILDGSDAVLEKKYGGVAVDGAIEAVYRVCLHSRLANRVFCELAQARVDDEEALYQAAYAIDWSQHLEARNSIAVAATVSRSNLNHGQYVALKVKDAIVDQFRERGGSRPVVSRKQPDLQVHVNIHRNQASISLDLSGDSLHRRGYRLEHTGAPLKEHLAAALLTQAGWNEEAGAATRLLDPMCGSGTFVIEAAMMSARIAPGLQRDYFGFLRWRRHNPQAWQDCLEQARDAILEQPDVEIYASDYDARATAVAAENARRAGVEQLIRFSHQQVGELELPATRESGRADTLVICNPPYGQRLQAGPDLATLYDDLGSALRRLAPARLAIISANPDLLHRLKLKRLSRKNVRNGPLDCLFALFATADRADTSPAIAGPAPGDDAAALPLRNRLQKNARHLQRWARRNDIGCYRVYDADLPEFAFALDRYQSDIAPDLEWFHLHEYQAPASIDADTAEHRIALAQETVRSVFGLAEDRLFCKLRSRQRGAAQYQKQGNLGEYFQVREGAAALLINLSDYLDSGLFLDHRLTRQRVCQQAQGRRMLNLFCYTAAVGVQAALAGASAVVNVDMSATYLKWARENFLLNELDDEARYQFLRADIVELLSQPEGFSLQADFDLIFLDPPTFSNSSKMRQTLDIQRDHETLVQQAMALLKANGMLLFSTNRRGFKLAPELQQLFDVRDITHATIDEDFKRNPKIHLCWEIRHRGAAQ